MNNETVPLIALRRSPAFEARRPLPKRVIMSPSLFDRTEPFA
jgi:hypothetical protein